MTVSSGYFNDFVCVKTKKRGWGGGGKRRLAQTRKCASVDEALVDVSKTAPSELNYVMQWMKWVNNEYTSNFIPD